MSKARFFLTNLEITLPGGKFSATAYVSPYGICRLLLPNGFDRDTSKGQVTFDDFCADIRLVKQYAEDGASFSARFENLRPEQADYLHDRAEKEGTPPAWARKFPRVGVAGLNEDENPHPAFCLVPWQGKEYKFRVENFTVSGLRLSYRGQLPNLRVGSMASISVYSSQGVGAVGLEVEVRNFSLLDLADGTPVTEMGVQFKDPRSPAHETFRGLIRECLVSLQARKL